MDGTRDTPRPSERSADVQGKRRAAPDRRASRRCCFRTTRCTKHSSTSTRTASCATRRFWTADARASTTTQAPGRAAPPWSRSFVPAGIEHILIGPDHVLFLDRAPAARRLACGNLATIVTAFTIGHSITLSLAALDVVSPPASIIEPAIALSIIFVGADNLLVQRAPQVDALAGRTAARRPRDIRPLVAAVFGLVHGFGFASVLKEFGLPMTALGWSLLSFNLGVEIGQLVIVLLGGVDAARRPSSQAKHSRPQARRRRIGRRDGRGRLLVLPTRVSRRSAHDTSN